MWYNYSMMNESKQSIKKICTAMREAGIVDPDSTEGICFCAGDRTTDSSCPYPKCVVFEFTTKEIHKMRNIRRADIAKKYSKYGVSTMDIALIMGIQERTAMEYILR